MSASYFTDEEREKQSQRQWWMDAHTGEIIIRHDNGVWRGIIGEDYIYDDPCSVGHRLVPDAPVRVGTLDEIIAHLGKNEPLSIPQITCSKIATTIKGFGKVDITITSGSLAAAAEILSGTSWVAKLWLMGLIPRHPGTWFGGGNFSVAPSVPTEAPTSDYDFH